ncbi:MAG: DNA polymerase/3'-5' exonuclease PolX [Deltaproteobacteria bacterium]|nr:DNA polymerase/3'-5' exonuclease PolX [Deltaproteobacteria bacterium]
MDAAAIAAALREIAQHLTFRGENQFKVRAYENGAQALESLGEDLGKVIAEKRLTQVRGIGSSLAEKIEELHRTGATALLDELRAGMPPGVLEIARLPDLGPKKAKALHDALGVGSVAELEAACVAGKVRALKGFGPRSEDKILAGIKRASAQAAQGGGRILLSSALEVGEPLLAHLRALPAVRAADLAGSLRRWRETVADLDVIVGSDDPGAVMDHFVAYPGVGAVEARGDTKCTLRLQTGLQIDLRVVPPGDYATALHHFTGSKAHHVVIRGRARERGLTISEWGVERLDGSGKLEVGSEAALYQLLELPYIPPELRENQGELEAADAGDRFEDLVQAGDVRGLIHCHTTYSDGKNSVEDMARAADALGAEYLTITDHSPAAAYAGGVGLERLLEQWDEIDRVQPRVKVRILRGTESDILEDGALDYPPEVLERLDVVIASIHSRMKMDAEKMTARLIAAMRHPVFKIWGHPLGRRLLEREPFGCDVEAVLDAAAASRAAIEINGDPHRLDLEPKWIRLARARGLRFVVSTDAHSVQGLGYLRYGVATARRGGVRKSEVLNTRPLDAFLRAVRPAAG